MVGIGRATSVKSGAARHAWTTRAYVTPMLIGLAVFGVYPAIYLLLLSISESKLGDPFASWVGLDNVRTALKDDVFIQSLQNSVGFAVLVSVVQLVLGVAIAVSMQHSVRGGHVVRTLILLPLMTPPMMVATAWKLIFNPGGGLLNGWLQKLGLIDKPVSYIGSNRWAFPAIGIADTWQWTPFVALLAFAALQSLPTDVIEAARVDGASAVWSFWSIELPLIMPALASIFLIKVIIGFKVFDLIYAITAGGPGFTTTTTSFLVWRTTFRQFDVGYAAAMTVVFGILVGLLTLPIGLFRAWAIRRWA